jgi:hypothetical protein
MKKVFLSLVLVLMLFGVTACTQEKGAYKPGTYFIVGDATTIYDPNFSDLEAYPMVTLVVDKNGFIAGISIDTTYPDSEGNYSTKRILGYDYGMKDASPVEKEWFEQADLLAEEIIKNQGLEGIVVDEDGKVDSIAGVTMVVDLYLDLIEDILEEAKK